MDGWDRVMGGGVDWRDFDFGFEVLFVERKTTQVYQNFQVFPVG